MEVMCNSEGGIHSPALIPTMLIMIMMLLNAYCCGATAVLAKSNTSVRRGGGHLDEWLIEEDLELELGLELGFLMNPYVSRILEGNHPESPNSSDPNKPAFSKPCGKSGDPGYSGCTAEHKSNPSQCVRKSGYSRC